MLLLLKSKNGIQTWTLNHPKEGNSLGLRMYHELDQALRLLEADCNAWIPDPEQQPLPHRCLIITATTPETGKRPVWIAGGNLRELSRLREKSQARQYAQNMSNLCHRLTLLPIPVIFSIHGQAIGGGAELSLFGDFRLASSQSSFHFKQLAVGLCCGYGSSQTLASLTGKGRAWDILTRREPLSAEEASRIGLVHSVHTDPDTLMAATESLATSLCRLEPQALAAQKHMFSLRSLPQETRDAELEIFANLWMNPTHRQYLRDFTARNKPEL